MTEGNVNDRTTKRRRKTQNISLSDVYQRALRYLAEQDAKESKQDPNVSAAMRKLIDARMRSEVGRDWESSLATATAP